MKAAAMIVFVVLAVAFAGWVAVNGVMNPSNLRSIARQMDVELGLERPWMIRLVSACVLVGVLGTAATLAWLVWSG